MSDSDAPQPETHPPPYRYCGACGHPAEPGTVICTRCSAPLYVATAPAAPAPAQAPLAPRPAQRSGETNGLAIASLVLGILWLYWLGSILAIVFGHIALAQIHRRGSSSTGRGMAIAGLILGYVGIAIAILIIALVLSLPMFHPGNLTGHGIVV